MRTASASLATRTSTTPFFDCTSIGPTSSRLNEPSPPPSIIAGPRAPVAAPPRAPGGARAGPCRRRSPLDEHDLPPGLAEHDPELQVLRARHGDAVPRPLRDAFAALPSRDRALLRMHFLDGLNLERLGLVFQVSRATAGRMMLATRTRLLDDTLALLRARLSLQPEELESLLGALRSKLDVSLHALFREP